MLRNQQHRTQAIAAQAASGLSSPGWAVDRCIRSEPHHLPCQQCIDACPVNALSFTDEISPTDDLSFTDGGETAPGGIRLTASHACHGCGACIPACPTEALLSSEHERIDRHFRRDLRRDLQDRPDADELSLRCHRVITDEPCINIHCLRSVAPDQLLAWQQHTAGQPIRLHVAENCRGCEAAPSSPEGDSWWQSMAQIAALISHPGRPFQPAIAPGPSRRQFLTGHYSGQAVYSETGVRARRLERTRAALNEELPESFHQLPTVQLNTERCHAHGICAHVCPTGAIALDKDGRLSHQPDQCIDCGFCVSHCPEQALDIQPGDQPGRRTLRTSESTTCFECRREFPVAAQDMAMAGICPACRRDRSLFEEDFKKLFG